MTGPAAKGKTLWPALVAAVALLLTAPQVFASRTASARPELLASPVLERTAAQALAPAYVPRGFELRLDPDPHPRQLALFPGLALPRASFVSEKLASGPSPWEPRPNLQRIQVFAAETWWVREHLGPIDSPNLYQAFGLDGMNVTDPWGMQAFHETFTYPATMTTCVVTRPQGDMSQPCVDVPPGKIEVTGVPVANNAAEHWSALNRTRSYGKHLLLQPQLSDEDVSVLVSRYDESGRGEFSPALAQGAKRAGAVAEPAFHLTMAFVSTFGPGMLAESWAMPLAYVEGLGDLGGAMFLAKAPKSGIDPRLQTRLAAWKAYEGEMDMAHWVKATKRQYGDLSAAPSGYGDWLHKVALAGEDNLYLYQKIGASGEHLKFGVTKDLLTRYTQRELGGGYLRRLAYGPKSQILTLERQLHETLPLGSEEGQLFYRLIQQGKGLRP